jgi:RNA recognition motif-containing protein
MAKKIYVGNMPFTTTEEEIRTLFGEAGAVTSVSVITDRFTGRSRGFAFVEMNDADAEKAVQMLNGRKIGDRALVVNEARPMGERKPGGGGGGGGYRGGGGGGRREGGGGGGYGRDR